MQPPSAAPPASNEPWKEQRSSVATKIHANPLIFVACLAIAVVLFIADVLMPAGATPAIGYSVIPLLAVQTGRRWFVLGMMGLCTIFTWAAYFIEPSGAAGWISVFERSMVTSVLWFSFVLVWQRTKALNGLARQAKLLAEVNQELARSNQELDTFAAVASHDIRGPLATTGMFASLLANRLGGKIDRESTEWISLIQSEVQRMNSIVESLLEYSRFNLDPTRIVDCECETILANVLQGLRADIAASGANVTRDPLPKISGDPVQLTVLFQNLIANAIKYRSGAQPKIHISVVVDQTGWTFSVRDNGVGIDPGDADRIFELFQRGQDNHKGKGWGIGLATCKKITELHGGRIWVESALGKGSTFYFTIPNRPSYKIPSPTEETRQARSATA